MIYDIIVVGGGPAGMTAALYAARYMLKVLVLTEEAGGTMNEANPVCNFPGFVSIHGFELMEKMKEQVEKLDVEIKEETVADIQKSNNIFLIKTKENEYEARTVLIATGSKRRKLNIPDEEKYLGKGVSYCATCDAALYKNKIAAVLGGSDAAAQSALLAAEYASKVYIIYRKEKLRAEPIHIENISKNRKIEVICNANVAKIEGNGFVKGVVLDNDYKGSKKLRVDGIFIEIGSVPSTGLAKSLGVEMNPENEIIVDEKSRTNVEGVYAAGDVTQSVLKQAVTACAQGAIAAYSAYKLLRRD